MKLSEILKFLDNMFLPRLCALCDETISYEQANPFCEECMPVWEEFVKIKCTKCGKTHKDCRCLPTMVKKASGSSAAWCVFYDSSQNGDMNRLFYRLKYKYDRCIIDFCTTKMKRKVISLCIRKKINYKSFAITYTPRRKLMAFKYGFDQSKKLAYSLGKKLNLPVIRCFENTGKTEQKALDLYGRVENAKKSYKYIDGSLGQYKNVFIVDDILTTGATFSACAEILREHGAERVIPVVFAKDNYHHGTNKDNGGK